MYVCTRARSRLHAPAAPCSGGWGRSSQRAILTGAPRAPDLAAPPAHRCPAPRLSFRVVSRLSFLVSPLCLASVSRLSVSRPLFRLSVSRPPVSRPPSLTVAGPRLRALSERRPPMSAEALNCWSFASL